MKIYIKILTLVMLLGFTYTTQAQTAQTDPIAENMLVYQRSVGGWPKAVAEVKVDYNKVLTDARKAATLKDAGRIDATIDNSATYKEITYLVGAYKQTNNKAYLQSAEKGIRYLLKAQYANGGWPQYYPDSALYRAQITYNDNAMMNVMEIMYNVANRKNGFDVVDASLVAPAANAVKRGIDCILKTQIKVNGKLTAWNQQYDHRTLQPVMARKFELVGLASSESAAIVQFLMQLPSPSTEIKAAIKGAVEWFDDVKLKGIRFDHVPDAANPGKKDGVVVPDSSSVIWARYYEIGTNKPFFSGRNSEKRYNLTEIEQERRGGYAWYGVWPKKILDKQYPAWAKKNGVK
ncbi:pectate lyase [Mucilaginibacter sp. PAMB04168]|uniref:pectate lyase n=1 Tax=Mucilaginibacter sp. PAMB04168 TaxID=3138567 RepID=UPI0031F70884